MMPASIARGTVTAITTMTAVDNDSLATGAETDAEITQMVIQNGS